MKILWSKLPLRLIISNVRLRSKKLILFIVFNLYYFISSFHVLDRLNFKIKILKAYKIFFNSVALLTSQCLSVRLMTEALCNIYEMMWLNFSLKCKVFCFSSGIRPKKEATGSGYSKWKNQS